MNDQAKSKEELVKELEGLRLKLAELEGQIHSKSPSYEELEDLVGQRTRELHIESGLLAASHRTLAESEERFRMVGETSRPFGVWWCDAEGRAEHVSPSFLKLLNMTMEEIRDFGWSSRLVPEDIEAARERWLSCVRTGKMWGDEHRIIDRNGEIRTVLARGLPVHNESGKIISWVGINLDITGRKKMEEELRQAHDHLELLVQERTTELQKANCDLRQYSAKLEVLNRELQDFAHIASHDLQEPLRKIVAFGDRLKAKCEAALSDEGCDYLERMQNAAKRMQTLIQNLLDLSSVATRVKPFRTTDLTKIIEEVTSDLEPRIEETGATVDIDNLAAIPVDPSQMRQLFQNLIGNSLKFTREEKPLIRIYGRYAEGDSQYQVFVEDNGIGFDEIYLDRIFSPFQRLHGRSAFEGTGIGLAICRKIMDRHGGSITARSERGVGSTFILTFP